MTAYLGQRHRLRLTKTFVDQKRLQKTLPLLRQVRAAPGLPLPSPPSPTLLSIPSSKPLISTKVARLTITTPCLLSQSITTTLHSCSSQTRGQQCHINIFIFLPRQPPSEHHLFHIHQAEQQPPAAAIPPSTCPCISEYAAEERRW